MCIRDRVKGAEVVISMLPASKHVEGLYLDQDLLGKIPASALVIECSTIAPDSARKVAQAAEVGGIAMIDAPVSGGTGGADGRGVEDRTKCAIAFCERVKELGYKPGVYASTTWYRKRVDYNTLRSRYTIWNAHYGVSSSPVSYTHLVLSPAACRTAWRTPPSSRRTAHRSGR